MPRVSRLWICLLITVLPLAACSDGGPKNRRPTHKVTVIVTQKGKPVDGATVTFINQEGEPAIAYGKTDAEGKAKMKTYVEGDGAVAGRHKVLIEKSESIGGAPTVDQNSKEYDPNAPPAQIKYLLPQKYSNPATSGLTAEVKEGQKELTFDLP